MKTFRVDWEAIIIAPKKGRKGGFSFIKAEDEKEAEKKFRKDVFKGELVSFTFVKLEIKEDNGDN